MVVDGGSTDGTADIARARQVRVVTSPRTGLYASLNAGFSTVKGDWLTWINADDLLYASALPDRLRDARDTDVMYGAVDFIDADGRFVHSWLSAAPRDLLRLYKAGYSPLLQQGTLFHRRVFEGLDGFDEAMLFVGDADFWWRALEHGVRLTRQAYPPVAAFRLHPGQLSQRHANAMRLEHDAMVKRHGGRSRPLSAWLSLLRFRGANLSRYAVRCMRRRDLDGRLRMSRGYDIPGSSR